MTQTIDAMVGELTEFLGLSLVGLASLLNLRESTLRLAIDAPGGFPRASMVEEAARRVAALHAAASAWPRNRGDMPGRVFLNVLVEPIDADGASLLGMIVDLKLGGEDLRDMATSAISEALGGDKDAVAGEGKEDAGKPAGVFQ